MRSLRELGERKLIKKLLATYGSSPGWELGYDDDAANMEVGDMSFLISTDMVNELNHKCPGSDWEDLGYYSVVVNLSDILAMGAMPKAVLVAIGLPPDMDVESAEKISEGIGQACKKYDVDVIGGDTKSSGLVELCLTCVGISHPSRVVERSLSHKSSKGYVYITPRIGQSGCSLYLLGEGGGKRKNDRTLVENVMMPKLGTGLALRLGTMKASGLDIAMMDNSDGLARSLYILSGLNGVSIELERSGFEQLSEDLRKEFDLPADKDPMEFILYHGGDFGLVVLSDRQLELDGLQEIGEYRGGKGVGFIGQEGVLPEQGYEHFLNSTWDKRD